MQEIFLTKPKTEYVRIKKAATKIILMRNDNARFTRGFLQDQDLWKNELRKFKPEG